jgi:hypothetical protein
VGVVGPEVESVATHIEQLGNAFDAEDVMKTALKLARDGAHDLGGWP